MAQILPPCGQQQEISFQGCFALGVVEPEEKGGDERGITLFATATLLYYHTAEGPQASRRQLGGRLKPIANYAGQVALSWVSLHRQALALWLRTEEDQGGGMEPTGLHVSCGPLATVIEGPSIGCAVVVAAISALTGRHVPVHTAVTAQMDLRGNVMGVGGLSMKMACAKVSPLFLHTLAFSDVIPSITIIIIIIIIIIITDVGFH